MVPLNCFPSKFHLILDFPKLLSHFGIRTCSSALLTPHPITDPGFVRHESCDRVKIEIHGVGGVVVVVHRTPNRDVLGTIPKGGIVLCL